MSEIREYTVATEGGTFTLEKTAKRFATEGCIFCPSEKKKKQKEKKKRTAKSKKKSLSCSSNNLNPGYFLWRRQRC